ncbi:MAG: GNAT family N-acetyltransferase [Rhodothermales bacterium]|nr:GNAT family N-acetyltransferase [Rhodothermales bacterium]
MKDRPIIRPDAMLTGEIVRLRPLQPEDAKALSRFGLDQSLWRWTPRSVVTLEDMEAYVREAIEARDAGTAVPFVVEMKDSGVVAGCTRYGNIAVGDRRLEIGWTWIDPVHQGSAVNTEMKFLMFEHAFESLGMNRVELKTDARNVRSRAAMRAVGCTEEGTLRRHLVTESGHVRDTVYFSVIAEEWPRVRAHLLERLRRKRS